MTDTNTRPNILLFITDQQRADHLGCAGNPLLRTPNIDSLAATGRRFSRSHVANPICMPNRASLMTGRMPSLHGVRHNGIALSRRHHTFVDLLAAAGWRTALIGKSHLQNFGHDGPHRLRWVTDPDRADPPPNLREAIDDERLGPGYDSEWTPRWESDPAHGVETPYYGFQDVRLCTYHGDVVGGDYARWLAEVAPEHADRRGPSHAISDPRYVAPQAQRTPLPPELYPSSYIAGETVAWLENHVANHASTPFFVQCSFTDPHHPFTPPGRYWDMYDPADVALPVSFQSGQLPAGVARLHERTKAGEIDRNFVLPFAVSERECREAIALTYGMIALIDDCVGRVLGALEALDLRRDTLILFTSDHGDWMGDHGIMLKGPFHYQGLVRTPLIWCDPAENAPGTVSEGLVSTIDIPASILERAGLRAFNGMQGRPLLLPDAPGRDALLIENDTQSFRLGDHLPRVRTLITDDGWRLSLYVGTEEGELYHLPSDPHEIHNRFDDPTLGAERERLFRRMVVELSSNQDICPLPSAQA